MAGFIGTPPMNMFESEVTVTDTGVDLTIGGQTVAAATETLARYPGVRHYGGKTIVLGIRSDDLVPARSRPDLPTLSARLDLVEALGSHSIVYFRVDAPALRSHVVEEEDVMDEADAEGVQATRPNLVSTFPARDTIGLKVGEEMPIAVDMANAHLFDLETGEPLR